jgi:hypothetical protein
MSVTDATAEVFVTYRSLYFADKTARKLSSGSSHTDGMSIESSSRLPLEILCGPSTNGAQVAANVARISAPPRWRRIGADVERSHCYRLSTKGGFAQRNAEKTG